MGTLLIFALLAYSVVNLAKLKLVNVLFVLKVESMNPIVNAQLEPLTTKLMLNALLVLQFVLPAKIRKVVQLVLKVDGILLSANAQKEPMKIRKHWLAYLAIFPV